MNNNFRKYAAFTLAEVLITLGIIGVVAAMTLPTLVAKYQDKQFKTAYKKAYRDFSAAFLRMQAADEVVPLIVYIKHSDVLASDTIGENFKIISKYFKVTKSCFNNNAAECWECNDGQAGSFYSSAPDYLGCTSDSYAFTDASGRGWYLYDNIEYPILVDVNGKQKPNRLGKDRFVFRFASNSDKTNHYPDTLNIILPIEDIKNKTRWCPSGECLYQSWLLE